MVVATGIVARMRYEEVDLDPGRVANDQILTREVGHQSKTESLIEGSGAG